MQSGSPSDGFVRVFVHSILFEAKADYFECRPSHIRNSDRSDYGYRSLKTHLWTFLLTFVTGLAFSKLMKLSLKKGFIDRESYVAQYLALTLFTIGVVSTIGSDDLLAAFAAGTWILCSISVVKLALTCFIIQDLPSHGMGISNHRSRTKYSCLSLIFF